MRVHGDRRPNPARVRDLGLAWPLAGLRGLPWLGRTVARLTGLGHGAAVVRTVVWSLLGLLVFGALFASADALVAEWWSDVLPDLSLGTSVLRAFIAVAVGGAVLPLRTSPSTRRTSTPRG